MTYLTVQKSIAGIVDDYSERLYTLVMDDYSRASKSILDEMAKMWANAKSISQEEMYNFAIRYNRLEKMLKEIEVQYRFYSKQISKTVIGNSEMAITNSFYRNQYKLQFFTPADQVILDFSALNSWLVESSILGTAESWQKIQGDAFKKIYGNPNQYVPQTGTITRLLTENATAELNQIRSSISSSLIQGISYRDASEDIARIIGKYEKGKRGIEATGARYKALRIMRTEGNRNFNAGSYAQTQWAKSEGIGIKRQWLATLDGRTRDSHQALDGKFEDDEGLWHIGDDTATYPARFGKAKNSINCRCTVVDRIPGIPLDKRLGKDEAGKNKLFEWVDYEGWAKKNGLKQKENGAWTL